ncbi:MAG: hypothetical protein EZS28_033563 [Streblomastix strix]|uniref:Uncharacterized protein n=1 Tax=Streblomastix strix TaxID=222440 RepID=A0A5J4ULK4_9EUKA|nr:MAG: hypothetical protein EZS28_033563 [Streblomastix strix]
MQQKQEFYETARAIVSFTDSYTQNKQIKQNEQSESESISTLTDIVSSLQTLSLQILENNRSKQVIQIPKLLNSLSALSRYKVETHLREEIDRQRLKVRNSSRECLRYIQFKGDEQDQTELVTQGYGRVMCTAFCTAGGQGEEQDEDISNQLCRISAFLNELHTGINNDWRPSFQSLPLLARNTEEQMEEEGANEEIDAQMKNKGINSNIKGYAKLAKAVTLNRFIRRG